MKAHISILREQTFRRFFIASFVSFFGSGLHLVAATWFVLEKTGSSIAVAAIWISAVATGPLVLALSGATIDRMSRQKLLWILSLIRCFVVFSIPMLMWLKCFSLWQFYAMTVLGGIGFNISFPTEKALVHEIAKKNTLMSANALIEISIQIGLFLAAGASGFIYKYVHIEGVLVIDAVTFLIAAIIFRQLPTSKIVTAAQKTQPYLEAVCDGWRYLFQNRTVLLFTIIAFIPTAATLASNVVLPAYVRDVIRQGVTSYGVLDMSYGIGAFLSGIIILSLMRLGQSKIVIALIALPAAVLTIMPAIKVLWLAIALNLIFGFCNSSLRIILSTNLMEVTPKEFTGRISSTSLFFSTFFQLTSFTAVGYAVDHLSVSYGYGFLAALMIVTLIGFTMAERHQKNESKNPALATT